MPHHLALFTLQYVIIAQLLKSLGFGHVTSETPNPLSGFYHSLASAEPMDAKLLFPNWMQAGENPLFSHMGDFNARTDDPAESEWFQFRK